jgi:chromatin assembly factor 1 subunit B
MKVTVPEISFHNRDPVLSLDVQHNSPDDVIRMATGGTDTHVIVRLAIYNIGIITTIHSTT